MSKVPIEIAAILTEIERALELKLYYLAIAVTLSLPDICACLEFDPVNPRRANSETYSKWADDNIHFNNLTGMDMYYLRCGVSHFGHFKHSKSAFDRVIFIGPESPIKIHDNVVDVAPGVVFGSKSSEELQLSGKLLHMDVSIFCANVIDAVRRWSVSKENDPYVRQNLPKLVRYRPNGLPPFSVGVPTIA